MCLKKKYFRLDYKHAGWVKRNEVILDDDTRRKIPSFIVIGEFTDSRFPFSDVPSNKLLPNRPWVGKFFILSAGKFSFMYTIYIFTYKHNINLIAPPIYFVFYIVFCMFVPFFFRNLLSLILLPRASPDLVLWIISFPFSIKFFWNPQYTCTHIDQTKVVSTSNS